MKIAFFGGSFNPPHKGHIQTAEFAKKALNLHKVVFLITPHNPFKSKKDLLCITKRVSLLRNIATKPWMKVSTIETKFRTAESINTARFLAQLHQKDKIYFIIGTDNLIHLHKWRNINEILQKINIIAVNRGGSNLHKIVRRTKIHTHRVRFLYQKTAEISSTEIRNANKSLHI